MLGQVRQRRVRMLLNIPHVDGLINKSFERGDPLLSSSNPPPVVNFGYTLSSLVLHQVQFPYEKKTTSRRPSPALCKATFCAREGTEEACITLH